MDINTSLFRKKRRRLSFTGIVNINTSLYGEKVDFCCELLRLGHSGGCSVQQWEEANGVEALGIHRISICSWTSNEKCSIERQLWVCGGDIQSRSLIDIGPGHPQVCAHRCVE